MQTKNQKRQKVANKLYKELKKVQQHKERYFQNAMFPSSRESYLRTQLLYLKRKGITPHTDETEDIDE